MIYACSWPVYQTYSGMQVVHMRRTYYAHSAHAEHQRAFTYAEQCVATRYQYACRADFGLTAVY